MGKHKKHRAKKHKKIKKGNEPGRQIIITQVPKPQPSTSAQSLASRNAFFTWVHRLDEQVYALELDVFQNSSRAFGGHAEKITKALKDVDHYQSTVKNLYEHASRNEIDLNIYSTAFANIGRHLVKIQKRLEEKPEGVNVAPHLQWLAWAAQFFSAWVLNFPPLVLALGGAQLLLANKVIKLPPPLLLPERALSLQETDEIATSRFEGVEQNQSIRSNHIERVLRWIAENL